MARAGLSMWAFPVGSEQVFLWFIYLFGSFVFVATWSPGETGKSGHSINMSDDIRHKRVRWHEY